MWHQELQAPTGRKQSAGAPLGLSFSFIFKPTQGLTPMVLKLAFAYG
jgi:hypothetical protein